MSPLFSQIEAELGQLANAITNVLNDERAISLVHGNWSFPGVAKRDLIAEVKRLRQIVIDRAPNEDIGVESLGDFSQRIAFLRTNTVPNLWGNAGQAVPVFLATLWALERALEPVLVPLPNADSAARLAQQMRAIEARLKGLESRLNLAAPRVETLEAMLQRIEDAHASANQLPADLEALADARKQIAATIAETNTQANHIGSTFKEVDATSKKLAAVNEQADKILERCEAAFKGSTSVGLGAAFDEQAKMLKQSMLLWTCVLIVALACGGVAAWTRGDAVLAKLNDPTAAIGIIVANIVALLLSVGGPVWLAWLASKQVGYRFRLAEDYAYKASISRAYEGYSAEAIRVDKALEARLLASALDRLDELPLRVVEPSTHGSPAHELLSSSSVAEAIKTVPNFIRDVQDLAKSAIDRIKGDGSDKGGGSGK